MGAEQRELEPRPRRGRQLAHDHIERRLHARRVGIEHGRDARLVALHGGGGLLDRGVERADRRLVLGHAVRVAALDHIEHAPVDRLKVLVARLDRRLARLDQLPRRHFAHALGARGDLGGHHLIHHDELRTQRADGLLGVWGARHAQLELVQQGARCLDGFGLGQRRKATERLGQLDRVLIVAAFRGRRRLDGAQRLGRPLLKRPERFGHLELGLDLGNRRRLALLGPLLEQPAPQIGEQQPFRPRVGQRIHGAAESRLNPIAVLGDVCVPGQHVLARACCVRRVSQSDPGGAHCSVDCSGDQGDDRPTGGVGYIGGRSGAVRPLALRRLRRVLLHVLHIIHGPHHGQEGLDRPDLVEQRLELHFKLIRYGHKRELGGAPKELLLQLHCREATAHARRLNVLLDAGKGEFGQARVGQVVNLAVDTEAPVHIG